MNTKTINLFARLQITLSLLLIIILSSCQNQSPLSELKNEVPPTPTLNQTCIEGNTHSFGLEQVPPNPEAVKAFQLRTTGFPFRLVDCVCNVIEYSITLNPMPAVDEIRINDQNGNPIFFTVESHPMLPQGDIVILPEDMYDSSSEIHLSMEESPSILRAGGLCVVDNLGGGGNGNVNIFTWHTAPVIIKNEVSPGFWLTKLLIPTAMTD